ncbi:MAG: ATP-binding protein [Armatimonas sp.]
MRFTDDSIDADSRLSSRLARARRDRRLILGLVLALFVGLIFYLVMTLSSSYTLRARQAGERNESTARLCAQLLDEQSDSAFSVLRSLVQRPDLSESIRRNDKATVAKTLRNAVELVPDLLGVGVYSTQGSLIEQFPARVKLPTDITQKSWYRQVMQARPSQQPAVNDVVRLPDADNTEAFTIAIPVRSGQDAPAGFLLAYFRLGNFYDWLKSVRLMGGAILILDSQGHVAATSDNSYRGQVQTDYAPFAAARQGKHGSADTVLSLVNSQNPTLSQNQKMMVGYAYAALPGWVVFVVQPTEAAQAPFEYLLRRLAVIGVPLLLAVPLVGWTLLKLYERLQRLATALGQRNELLRQLNQAKSDLLANVSHDLKTPIASMQLSVSGILESEEPVPPDAVQVQECLTLVSQELDTLAARVRNLLDMSRLESEAAPILREPCDLTDIVISAMERVRPLLEERAIQADFPRTPLLVMGDPSQLETVVLNLLENALKYSPEGTPLQLMGELKEHTVTVAVSNQGEGVPAGQESRIFEKFYRPGTSMTPGGTGLGLAICKTIVEAHGGEIHASNLPEGGARLWFRLPHCEVDF